MADMTYPGSSLASLFNRHHTVGKDLAIDPDPDLHSYQDDIDHSNTKQVKEVTEGLTEKSDLLEDE